jgi:serine/threonine protein kinase
MSKNEDTSVTGNSTSNGSTVKKSENKQQVSTKEYVVGDKYILTSKKLGSGAFGEIYEGYDIQTKEKVAIKLESQKAKHPQLHFEARLIKLLNMSKRKNHLIF